MVNNCFGALPTIYTEALSYYETVCKVLNKINEVIDEVNRATEIVDNNNTDVESVKQQMSELSAELQRYKNELELNLANYKDGINQQMLNFAESVSVTVNDFKGEVNTKLLEQDSTIQQGLSDIEEEVPEMVAGTVRSMVQTGEFDEIIGSEFEEAVSVKTVNAGQSVIEYRPYRDVAYDTKNVKYSKVSGDVTIAYMGYYDTPDGYNVDELYCPELTDGVYELYMAYSVRQSEGNIVPFVPADGSRLAVDGYFPNPYAGDQGGEPGTNGRFVIFKFAKVN